MTKTYTITTEQFGEKYNQIVPHWMQNTIIRCPKANVLVLPINRTFPPDEVVYNSMGEIIGWKPKGEAFWDTIRLHHNIQLMKEINQPIVHCDLDVILTKDIEPIVLLSNNYDMVFSAETWGHPLHFCSGFYIINQKIKNKKMQTQHFAESLLEMMCLKKYGTYSDQNTLQKFIQEQHYEIKMESCFLSGKEYMNTIVSFNKNNENINICILNMDIITRDPMETKTQFGNHINVDNVGGKDIFIRFFYERIEDLPITCRCGKAKLGNTDVCTHRKNWINTWYQRLK